MNFSLKCVMRCECSFCKDNHLSDETDLATLLVFGAKEYAICPQCLNTVSKKKMKSKVWIKKVNKLLEKEDNHER